VGAVAESALPEWARTSPRVDKALILEVNFAGALGRTWPRPVGAVLAWRSRLVSVT